MRKSDSVWSRFKSCQQLITSGKLYYVVSKLPLWYNRPRSYIKMPCFIHSSDGISAVLCMRWTSCTPVRRLIGRIVVFSKDSFSILSENQTHKHWSEQPSQSKYRSSLFVIFVSFPLWYWFQHLIGDYISGNTYRRTTKYAQEHFVLMKVVANQEMKSIRTSQLY